MDVATVFKMTGLSKNLERFDCKAYSEQRCKKKRSSRQLDQFNLKVAVYLNCAFNLSQA
ncbi:Uncharacterised protein [Anaerobiospirillum thomasii]|uniref:Uncharacterized protein n=1 Tax=Anaerobiospirillum thomasii TaxID=179995 RepID=A0A2X0WTH0_9GAMM|nr:Uncharacterised protein [Anaerobiospirillum thomasii]